MRSVFPFLLLCLFFVRLSAQESETVLLTGEGNIFGTLSIPDTNSKVPVVLIIAGSGPTDRNGNNRQMENNSLKMLADTLVSHGIASLRYDKRGVGQSDRGVERESDIVLEHFVNDALLWVDQLAADDRFSSIIIAGHSEGSLIGTLAGRQKKEVSAFISIAGPGRPLDDILKEQLSGAVPEARAILYGIIDQLKAGDTVPNVPPLLQPLFRRGVQPFIISAFNYDPAVEFAGLKIPSLVISGTTDIQVKQEDAEKLAAANPRAKLVIIPDMNHVLKTFSSTDKKEQVEKTYDAPELPLNARFAQEVVTFIKTL